MNNSNVAIITGTSSGVGKALADILVGEGFFVEGCSRRSTSIQEDNYQHSSVDVTDEEAVRKWIQSIEQRHGSISVAINCAGQYRMSPLLTTSTPLATELMQTNFIGTLNVCREVGRVMMKKKYGRIINVSSIAVSIKDPNTAVYTASKCAVSGFTQVIAKELAPLGITCNVLELSIFESEITESMPTKTKEDVVNRLVVKRFAEKKDLAHVVRFLTSPDSGYVTGEIVRLGGGC